MPGRKHGANRVNFRSASTGDRKPPSLNGSIPVENPTENHSATTENQIRIMLHDDFRCDTNRNSSGKIRYIWISSGRLHRGPGLAFCRAIFWIRNKFEIRLPEFW